MFYGKNKTEAKKAAAFFLLLSIFKAGGIEKEEWKQQEKEMVDEQFRKLAPPRMTE